MEQKKILCVGLVCLDIINVVDKYPDEDTDTRCVSQRWQRGGNASNSCTVLSLLGAPSAFLGSLSAGPVADFILNDFQLYQIDISHLTEHAQCSCPASIVIISQHTGTRTILHMNSFIVEDFGRRGVDISGVAWQQRGVTPCACCVVCPASGSRTVLLYDTNLPDVSVEDFCRLNLSHFTWIHFEGRNAEDQVKMIEQVRSFNLRQEVRDRITVSVEIEKTRQELYQLFPHGDLVFISKDVALHFGFSSGSEAVRGLYPRVRNGGFLICAWGEKGADALGPDGTVVHSDAFPPERLVDTLGAGDTFNAAVMYNLSTGGTLQEALTFGCQIAGKKCGVHGYEGILEPKSELSKKH